MPIFDELQRASFAGIEFPVSEINIDGGLRDHVHEFPHAPGGAPEKLGRRLYVFRMRALFHATFRAYGFANLYPRAWNRLRNIAESERSEDLVVPTFGTVKAYCFNWPETATAKQRSGVNVEFSFREDPVAFFINGLLISGDSGLQQAQQRLAYVAEVYAQTPPGQIILEAVQPDGPDRPLVPPPDALKQDTLDLLGLIDDALNALIAVDDAASFAELLIDTKIQRVISLCKELDRRATMRDPKNHPLFEALRNVWSATDKRRRDVARQRERLILYITPRGGMSVADIARDIYGDTSRQMEILQLNAIRNPYDIPRESALRLYRPKKKAA